MHVNIHRYTDIMAQNERDKTICQKKWEERKRIGKSYDACYNYNIKTYQIVKIFC